jgi:hypothetical protein
VPPQGLACVPPHRFVHDGLHAQVLPLHELGGHE